MEVEGPRDYLIGSRRTSTSRWRVLPGSSSEPRVSGLPGVSSAVPCRTDWRMIGSWTFAMDFCSATLDCSTARLLDFGLQGLAVVGKGCVEVVADVEIGELGLDLGGLFRDVGRAILAGGDA